MSPKKGTKIAVGSLAASALVIGPVVATQQLWWPSEIDQEFLNKLRDQIIKSMVDDKLESPSFKVEGFILPQNAKKENIKFIGSLPDKVELNYGIVEDSANNNEGKLKIWFTLTHVLKSTSGEVTLDGFKTISDVIQEKEDEKRVDQLAKDATFRAANPEELAYIVNDENAKKEIIWNEKEDNTEVVFSEVKPQSSFSVKFKYQIKINNKYVVSSKVYEGEAFGWNSSDKEIIKELNELINTNAIKFDFINKETYLPSKAANLPGNVIFSGQPKEVGVQIISLLADDRGQRLNVHYKLTKKGYSSSEGVASIEGFRSLAEEVEYDKLNKIAIDATFSAVDTNMFASQIIDANIATKLSWNEKDKNPGIQIEYIGGSIVADDSLGELSFKFRFGEKSAASNKMIWSEIVTVKESVKGFKLVGELLKKAANEATFYVDGNRDRLASSVRASEIKWLQADENEYWGINVTYEDITPLDSEGKLGFKAIFSKSNEKFELSISLTDPKAISGFMKTEKYLDVISGKATFSVKNQQLLLPSQVTSDLITWDQSEFYENKDINVKFLNINPDDNTGKLGFTAVFSKDGINKEIAKEITGFKSIREKLQLILNEATFSVADETKKRIASLVKVNEIKWDQEQDPNNFNVKLTIMDLNPNDETGRLGFKVKFEFKDIALEHTIGIDDEKAIKGFLTIEQQLKDIAKTSTFKVDNLKRLPTEIANDEIIWEQRDEYPGITATFSALTPDDPNGKLGFTVTFGKDNKTYQHVVKTIDPQAIVGLVFTGQKLEEIVANATFDVTDKERLATEVQNSDINWEQQGAPGNNTISVTFTDLKPVNLVGKLGFTAIFTKDNIERKLVVKVSDAKSIGGFRIETTELDKIAQAATFSPIDTQKIASEINEKNASTEIKWNEQGNYDGVSISYSNVVANAKDGFVTFDYKIIKNGQDSSTFNGRAEGWKIPSIILEEVTIKKGQDNKNVLEINGFNLPTTIDKYIIKDVKTSRPLSEQEMSLDPSSTSTKVKIKILKDFEVGVQSLELILVDYASQSKIVDFNQHPEVSSFATQLALKFVGEKQVSAELSSKDPDTWTEANIKDFISQEEIQRFFDEIVATYSNLAPQHLNQQGEWVDLTSNDIRLKLKKDSSNLTRATLFITLGGIEKETTLSITNLTWKQNALANEATFEVLDSSKLAQDITLENIAHEVEWKEGAAISGASITYSNIRPNNQNGSITFDFVITINGVPSLPKEATVSGWATGAKELEQIAKTATFSLKDREIAFTPSIVGPEDLIWNEMNQYPDIKVEFSALTFDNENSKVGFNATFIKNDSRYTLIVDMNSDQAVGDFYVLARIVDQMSRVTKFDVRNKNVSASSVLISDVYWVAKENPSNNKWTNAFEVNIDSLIIDDVNNKLGFKYTISVLKNSNDNSKMTFSKEIGLNDDRAIQLISLNEQEVNRINAIKEWTWKDGVFPTIITTANVLDNLNFQKNDKINYSVIGFSNNKKQVSFKLLINNTENLQNIAKETLEIRVNLPTIGINEISSNSLGFGNDPAELFAYKITKTFVFDKLDNLLEYSNDLIKKEDIKNIQWELLDLSVGKLELKYTIAANKWYDDKGRLGKFDKEFKIIITSQGFTHTKNTLLDLLKNYLPFIISPKKFIDLPTDKSIHLNDKSKTAEGLATWLSTKYQLGNVSHKQISENGKENGIVWVDSGLSRNNESTSETNTWLEKDTNALDKIQDLLMKFKYIDNTYRLNKIYMYWTFDFVRTENDWAHVYTIKPYGWWLEFEKDGQIVTTLLNNVSLPMVGEKEAIDSIIDDSKNNFEIRFIYDQNPDQLNEEVFTYSLSYVAANSSFSVVDIAKKIPQQVKIEDMIWQHALDFPNVRIANIEILEWDESSKLGMKIRVTFARNGENSYSHVFKIYGFKSYEMLKAEIEKEATFTYIGDKNVLASEAKSEYLLWDQKDKYRDILQDANPIPIEFDEDNQNKTGSFKASINIRYNYGAYQINVDSIKTNYIVSGFKNKWFDINEEKSFINSWNTSWRNDANFSNWDANTIADKTNFRKKEDIEYGANIVSSNNEYIEFKITLSKYGNIVETNPIRLFKPTLIQQKEIAASTLSTSLQGKDAIDGLAHLLSNDGKTSIYNMRNTIFTNSTLMNSSSVITNVSAAPNPNDNTKLDVYIELAAGKFYDKYGYVSNRSEILKLTIIGLGGVTVNQDSFSKLVNTVFNSLVVSPKQLSAIGNEGIIKNSNENLETTIQNYLKRNYGNDEFEIIERDSIKYIGRKGGWNKETEKATMSNYIDKPKTMTSMYEWMDLILRAYKFINDEFTLNNINLWWSIEDIINAAKNPNYNIATLKVKGWGLRFDKNGQSTNEILGNITLDRAGILLGSTPSGAILDESYNSKLQFKVNDQEVSGSKTTFINELEFSAQFLDYDFNDISLKNNMTPSQVKINNLVLKSNTNDSKNWPLFNLKATIIDLIPDDINGTLGYIVKLERNGIELNYTIFPDMPRAISGFKGKLAQDLADQTTFSYAKSKEMWGWDTSINDVVWDQQVANPNAKIEYRSFEGLDGKLGFEFRILVGTASSTWKSIEIEGFWGSEVAINDLLAQTVFTAKNENIVMSNATINNMSDKVAINWDGNNKYNNIKWGLGQQSGELEKTITVIWNEITPISSPEDGLSINAKFKLEFRRNGQVIYTSEETATTIIGFANLNEIADIAQFGVEDKANKLPSTVTIDDIKWLNKDKYPNITFEISNLVANDTKGEITFDIVFKRGEIKSNIQTRIVKGFKTS